MDLPADSATGVPCLPQEEMAQVLRYLQEGGEDEVAGGVEDRVHSLIAKLKQSVTDTMESDPLDPSNVVLCAGTCSVDMVRGLISKGADLTAADHRGTTPLMYACEHSNVPVIRLLLDCGVPLDGRRPGSGFTALHAACFSISNMSADTLQSDCPAERRARAAEAVELLLRWSHHPDKEKNLASTQDANGKTPLELAFERWEPAGGVQLGQAATSPMCQRMMMHMMSPYSGSTALVHGLVGAPEHNGKRVALIKPVTETGRFLVDVLESGKKLRIKPANLQLTHAKPFQERVGGIVVEVGTAGQRGVLLHELQEQQEEQQRSKGSQQRDGTTSVGERPSEQWRIRLEEGGGHVDAWLSEARLVPTHGGIKGREYFS